MGHYTLTPIKSNFGNLPRRQGREFTFILSARRASDIPCPVPTFLPARTQRASESMAWLCLRPRSTSLASSTASSPGRPGSKAGDAMGDSSTLKRTEPSLGRSGNGGSRAATTAVMTRVVPMHTVQLLSSRENCMHEGRRVQGMSLRPSGMAKWYGRCNDNYSRGLPNGSSLITHQRVGHAALHACTWNLIFLKSYGFLPSMRSSSCRACGEGTRQGEA